MALFSCRLFIKERGSVREEVRLITPYSTHAGQTLTVTLTVQAHDSSDANYAVVYLLVLPEVRKTNILKIYTVQFSNL